MNGGLRIADRAEDGAHATRSSKAAIRDPQFTSTAPSAVRLPKHSLTESAIRGPRSTSSAIGFTLIELLVVIVIIGVIVSVATLSVNLIGRDSQAEEEARRFWAILRQTREEAELQGLNIGVFFATASYEFLRLDPLTNQWIPIGDDKLYASRHLPEGLRYRLWLDSREIVMKPQLPDRGNEEEDDEEQSEKEQEEADLPQALRSIDRNEPPPVQEDPPQIVVLSNGEIMPFELHIERDAQPALWRIVATAENDLRVEQRPSTTEDWEIIMQTHPPLDEAKDRARK